MEERQLRHNIEATPFSNLEHEQFEISVCDLLTARDKIVTNIVTEIGLVTPCCYRSVQI